MIKVASHLYTLEPRQSLNAVSSKGQRQGSLLKVQWEDGLQGYADLHPWPELGDMPLREQLLQLSLGNYTSSVQQSLCLARWDAELRSQGKNIFDVGAPIKNNFLVSDISHVTAESLQAVKHQGFDTLKIKVGKDSQEETRLLNRIASSGFKIRLDFNGVGSLSSFQKFMADLSSEARAAIEYVEDPFPYSDQTWAEARQLCPIALDNYFDQVKWDVLSEAPCDVLIVKPAKLDMVEVKRLIKTWNLKVTITNYMDHPVGTMHALGTAMELKKELGDTVLQAGCLTHHLYQADVFFAELRNDGPYLRKTAGTGVGFDHLLEALPWQLVSPN